MAQFWLSMVGCNPPFWEPLTFRNVLSGDQGVSLDMSGSIFIILWLSSSRFLVGESKRPGVPFNRGNRYEVNAAGCKGPWGCGWGSFGTSLVAQKVLFTLGKEQAGPRSGPWAEVWRPLFLSAHSRLGSFDWKMAREKRNFPLIIVMKYMTVTLGATQSAATYWSFGKLHAILCCPSIMCWVGCLLAPRYLLLTERIIFTSLSFSFSCPHLWTLFNLPQLHFSHVGSCFFDSCRNISSKARSGFEAFQWVTAGWE